MFSPEGLAAFHHAMHGLVDSGIVPGVVTLLARDDETRIDSYGMADVATGASLRDDAVFRIQSMTKPILAAATMQLVERRALRLDDPVERWLPELANRHVLRTPASELDDVVPARRPITVDDLLTCRSGYGLVIGESPIGREMEARGVAVGSPSRLVPSGTWLARLAELPLIHQPGEGWRYHTSFDILGILLARATAARLDDHLRERIFDPLGMPDTAMFVNGERARRLVAAYHHDESGTLVEDEPAGAGYYVGGVPADVSRAGLLSTARDFHRFASMLMHGGELEGVRILAPESVATMTRDHIDPAQKMPDSFIPGFWDTTGWGYGMGVLTARDAYGDPGRVSWSGGYGTVWFNDPNTGLIGIALMQVLLDGPMMGAVDTFYRAAYGTIT